MHVLAGLELSRTAVREPDARPVGRGCLLAEHRDSSLSRRSAPINATGQCPESCHRSRPIRAAVSTSPAAAIQTPAICQALARGRRSSSMRPLPLTQWGNHLRSQERQPTGSQPQPGCVVHPIPTVTQAQPPAAVDNPRLPIHRKDPARHRIPGAPPGNQSVAGRLGARTEVLRSWQGKLPRDDGQGLLLREAMDG